MTRQIERQARRAATKALSREEKEQARKTAKRALLERQTRREKSGAYTGTPVARLITPSRSRVTKRKVNKGVPNGRIIRVIKEGGREFKFHPTRGWRSYAA